MPNGSKVINIKKATISIELKLPAGEIIKYTEIGLLPNKGLPLETIIVHLFPYLKHALLSIGLFWDNICLDIFDEKEVRIIDKRQRTLL